MDVLMNSIEQLVFRKSTRCESGTCVEVATAREAVVVRDSEAPSGTVLRYVPAEWSDFLVGVKKGEFDRPNSA